MSHPLYDLLRRLEVAKIHYSLARHRDDTVLVTMTLVGERVEVDVFEDGHMEVSRFPGSEDIAGGAELVEKLIDANRDSTCGTANRNRIRFNKDLRQIRRHEFPVGIVNERNPDDPANATSTSGFVWDRCSLCVGRPCSHDRCLPCNGNHHRIQLWQSVAVSASTVHVDHYDFRPPHDASRQVRGLGRVARQAGTSG